MTTLATVLSLVALSATLVGAQTVRVVDDPRAEAISILFRIAGAGDFRDAALQPYIRQVDSAFARFSEHAVFAEIRQLRKDPGLRLSAVMSLAPQLSDAISFGERVPFDSPASGVGREWHGVESRKFLAAARDFARVADLAGFLRAHQPVYDSAAARMRRVIDARGHVDWFVRFFGTPRSDVFVVSPLLGQGGGNFGAQFRDGSVHERYAFIAILVADSLGVPVVPTEVIPTVAHEFAHSFVNAVVDASSDALRPAGERVFESVRRAMASQAYESWRTMLNESVVRATVIRYLLATDGKAAADRETRFQRGAGFVWMDELVAVFDEYEANRSRYPTLAAFMPRLVAYYTDLAPRVERMVAEYDGRRPRVVASSIADGATGVDPALGTLVLTFDHPVETIVNMVGDHGSNVPVITSVTFDATQTVLTLGIRLRPGAEYFVPLGPGGIVGRDGYPLQRFEVHFRTGAR